MEARLYGVRDTDGLVENLSYDPHHAHQAAARLRAGRRQAELVYTDDASDATNPEWAAAEAYETGYSSGERTANYGQAYEGADESTTFDMEVPGELIDRDADDYRAGFEDGVSDFWADADE